MSILTTPADLTKGADPSPWTVNGNDLYPDSLSYLVGIGTADPDTLLHIKAADGTPKIKLEGTDYDYTIEVDANPGGSQPSSLLRFESDTHWASNQIEFTNGSTHSGTTTTVYITSNAAGSIVFKDKDANKDKVAINANYTTERLQMYGEDGFTGGLFAMDWSQTSDARFAFGYGNEALSNAARLAIKHTSNPQLLLDDGSETTTIKTSATELTLEHSSTNWNFILDATTNTNLVFAKGGTAKAGLRHYGATAGLFGVNQGMWKSNANNIAAASNAITAPNGFGNVFACDTTSNAITLTLPAVADYSGVVFYVIDSKGNAATNNITVAVQTGEHLDGQINGTSVLSTNYNQALFVCTVDGWFEIK